MRPFGSWSSLTKREHDEAWLDAASPGGASLQACALALIFAACVESQRPTCLACGLWHDDATSCEVHAPGVGDFVCREPIFGADGEIKGYLRGRGR